MPVIDCDLEPNTRSCFVYQFSVEVCVNHDDAIGFSCFGEVNSILVHFRGSLHVYVSQHRSTKIASRTIGPGLF